MLLGAGQGPEGRPMIFVGLSEANIKKLKNDQPILKSLDPYGFPGVLLIIMGPEDTVRFCALTNTPLPPDMEE